MKILLIIGKKTLAAVVSVVIAPIATIFSLPKMVAIYLDPEIKVRKLSMADILLESGLALFPKRIKNGLIPNKIEIETSTLWLSNKIVSKYKVSFPYFCSQVILHIFYGFLLTTTTVNSIYKTLSSHQNANYPHKEFSIIFSLNTLLFPAICMLFANFNPAFRKFNFVLLSALDEITFPFKYCFSKNPSRLLNPIIHRANFELGNIQAVNIELSKTSLPNLTRVLLQKKSSLLSLDKLIVKSTGLTTDAANLVSEYYLPKKLLVFAFGKENLCKTLTSDQRNIFELTNSESEINSEEIFLKTSAHQNGELETKPNNLKSKKDK